MTAPSSHPSSTAPAGVWRRAAESSAIWRALTPARRAWGVVEGVIARVTMERDTEAADRRVERLVASSRLVRWADALGGAAVRASDHSAARRWTTRGVKALADLEPLARLRGGAQVVVIASLVAVVLQLLGPQPVALAMIPPAFAAIAALLVLLLARPFAAACKDRR